MKMRYDVSDNGPLALIIFVCLCVLGITHTNAVLAQTELPVKVQADLLVNKVIAAAKGGDLQEVLADINQLKELKVDVPPPILLVEAKAAHTTGDPLRAFTALKAYLGVSHDDSKGYKEALALYPAYQRDAAPAIQQAKQKKEQEEARSAEADRERAANEADHQRKELSARKDEIITVRSRCRDIYTQYRTYSDCVTSHASAIFGVREQDKAACGATQLPPEFSGSRLAGGDLAHDKCENEAYDLCAKLNKEDRPEECKNVKRCDLSSNWYDGKPEDRGCRRLIQN
jgi:hypothetical protein